MKAGPEDSGGRFPLGPTAWLAGGVWGIFGAFIAWPQLFAWLGIEHFGAWFLDSYAILAALEAVAQGADPHLPNALDVFGRPHVYSHWWLWLGVFDLDRSDNLWFGATWVAGFVIAALAGLRPRRWQEVLGALAVFGSAPVLLAFNRANNDLVVFVVLAVVVPCLMARSRAWHWLALGAIVLAAGLKYYPAAAVLVLAGGVDRRELVRRWLVAAAALGLVAISINQDLRAAAALVPRADGFLTFGARFLLDPLSLGDLTLGLSLSILLGAAVAGAWWITGRPGWALPADHRREHLAFILGAVLLSGCFWTGVNYGYRWIFSLWLLPWLWRGLADRSTGSTMRGWLRVTAVLLYVVLWLDPMAMLILNGLHRSAPFADVAAVGRVVFHCLQPVAWGFFFCLLVFLVQFLRPAGALLIGGQTRRADGGGAR
ncbi:MAG: hypothetical protein KF897_15910 [Opitutaceae bacterium]|nr:hypothetical protein [Opitutaceae bacterium]